MAPSQTTMSAAEFAGLLDAMTGHNEEWIAAVIAEAAKYGVSREEIGAARQRLSAPIDNNQV
jgi:hypothetical protein